MFVKIVGTFGFASACACAVGASAVGACAYYYARGMSTYVRNNYKSTRKIELSHLDAALADERLELERETPYTWKWLCEWSDVKHATMRRDLFATHTKSQLCNLQPWMRIFPFALLTTIKMAWRHFRTGCIRSKSHHELREPDHICKLNDNLT